MTETSTKTVDGDGNIIYKDSAGRRHKEDGPALIWRSNIWPRRSGRKEWYRHGYFHRENGPAWIDARDKPHWNLFGIQMDKKRYKKAVAELLHVRKCPLEELPQYFGTMYEPVAMERLAAA